MILRAIFTPNIPGTWHIIRSTPGREFVAFRHLANGQFGCYLPTIDKTELTKREKPLFPSYIFLFVWGLAENIGIVKQIPGIAGFLLNGEGVPVTVPDDIVRVVDRIEQEIWVGGLPRGYFRRKRKQEPWIIPQWSSPNHGFAHPDPDTRIAALHHALGLQ